MIKVPSTPLTIFLFPEDHVIGKDAFLGLIANPHETYIFAYNFSLPELLQEIKKADDAGIAIHCLIDHVQFNGPSEKEAVTKLGLSLKHGEIIVTTAGVNSDAKGQIWHYKTIVTLNPEGPQCWEGSVNFSSSGFSQGNSAMLFTSQEYADAVVAEFKVHKEWALATHPEYQIK